MEVVYQRSRDIPEAERASLLARALDLLKSGLGYRRVAAELGLGPSIVSNWARAARKRGELDLMPDASRGRRRSTVKRQAKARAKRLDPTPSPPPPDLPAVEVSPPERLDPTGADLYSTPDQVLEDIDKAIRMRAKRLSLHRDDEDTRSSKDDALVVAILMDKRAPIEAMVMAGKDNPKGAPERIKRLLARCKAVGAVA